MNLLATGVESYLPRLLQGFSTSIKKIHRFLPSQASPLPHGIKPAKPGVRYLEALQAHMRVRDTYSPFLFVLSFCHCEGPC